MATTTDLGISVEFPARVDLIGPLVSEGADELVSRHSSRGLVRDLAASIIDRNLRFLTRAQTLIHRQVGIGLVRLADAGGLEKLGYMKLGDYAAQVLGWSEREAQDLAHTERQLRQFPCIEREYACGRLLRSHVRLLLSRVSPDEDAIWADRAVGMTVRALDDALRAAASQDVGSAAQEAGSAYQGAGSAYAGSACQDAGSACNDAGSACQDAGSAYQDAGSAHQGEGCEPCPAPAAGPEDGEQEDLPAAGRWIQFLANPELICSWDASLEMARRALGSNKPAAACLEKMIGEFLAGEGGQALARAREQAAGQTVPLDSVGGDEAPPNLSATALSASPGTAAPSDRERELERRRELQRFLEKETVHWSFLDWTVPPVELAGLTPLTPDATAHDIDQALQQAVRLSQRVAGYTMRLLRTLGDFGFPRDMQFTSLGHYARERLGLSNRTVNAYLWLERRFLHLTATAEAFYSGRLTQAAARLVTEVVNDTNESNEKAWVRFAEAVTARRLVGEVDAAKRWRDSAPPGERRTPWPPEVSGFEGTGAPPVGTPLPDAAAPPAGPSGSCLEEAVGPSGSLPKESVAVEQSCAPEACPSGSTLEDAVAVEQSCAPEAEQPGVRGMPRQRPNYPIPAPLSTLLDRAHQAALAAEGLAEDLPEAPPVRVKFWLPAYLEDMWQDLVTACTVLYGALPPTDFCIECLTRDFLGEWSEVARQEMKRHRRLESRNWTCSVPVCSLRGNLHEHHIKFRSHGGSDADSNIATPCAGHHLRGIHTGAVHVRGQAPDGLTWVLGARPGGMPHAVFAGDVRVFPRPWPLLPPTAMPELYRPGGRPR